MKKLLLLLTFISTLYATNGEKIFDAKCASCHLKVLPEGMEESKRGTEEFAKAASKLVAPPLEKIVMRLDDVLISKLNFIAFVEDYIANPSKEKAKCRPHAIQKFGLMPAIGKSMSKEERKAVAEYMYSTKKAEKINCEMGGKCASGKCGGGKISKTPMKCGAGKCGGGK
jgi:uncharacterized low-complexity protein